MPSRKKRCDTEGCREKIYISIGHISESKLTHLCRDHYMEETGRAPASGPHNYSARDFRI